MKNDNYSNLYSRGQIKNMSLKNRIVMAPMGTFSEIRNGFPSQKQIEYYRARARGGAGLIMIEAQYTTNRTDPWIDYVTVAGTSEQMKGWSLLVEACQSEGAKVCIQLSCGLGRNAFPFSDDQMVSASEVPSFYFPDRLCRAFTKDEIQDIVEAYRTAARHALVAGADCLEIHAHGGYVIDQFMTPLWNKRTDEYGGNFENRMRLVTEIYTAMREVVGEDYPILLRMAIDHDFPGGRTLEEGLEIVKYLEKLGIDAFDLDLGAYENKQWIVPAIYSGKGKIAGDGCMMEFAAAAKKEVSVPIFSAGTMTPKVAEKGIANGLIDYAMFGRQLICDPDMPNKVLQCREEDVRPCLSCNEICVGRLYMNRMLSCAINPQALFETDYPLVQTKEPRHVVVVGGGPGGMEAARVAALQGNKVDLYEKSDALGGQLKAAVQPAFKERLKRFMEWQKLQIHKAGVQVHLNKALDASSPELAKADHIIVALGAEPFVPPIPGIDNKNVINVLDAHLNPELIKGQKIVVAGGGMSGCDCALELALAGKDVSIVEMQDELAPTALIDNRNPMLFRMEENDVKQYTGHTITAFSDKGVTIKNKDGEEKILAADTIIHAFGMKANYAPAIEICDKYPDTAMLGDCKEVAQIGGAVRNGFFAGWSIH